MPRPKSKKSINYLEPYSKEWQKEANALARSYMRIHPCQHCGHAVIHGYCCGNNEKCPDPYNP